MSEVKQYDMWGGRPYDPRAMIEGTLVVYASDYDAIAQQLVEEQYTLECCVNNNVVLNDRINDLERQLTEPCPYCSGTGTIKASATICYDILTEVKKVSSELDGYSLVLRVNPEIARALKDESRSVFRELESAVGRPVTIRPDEQLHHEQFDVMAI